MGIWKFAKYFKMHSIIFSRSRTRDGKNWLLRFNYLHWPWPLAGESLCQIQQKKLSRQVNRPVRIELGHRGPGLWSSIINNFIIILNVFVYRTEKKTCLTLTSGWKLVGLIIDWHGTRQTMGVCKTWELHRTSYGCRILPSLMGMC